MSYVPSLRPKPFNHTLRDIHDHPILKEDVYVTFGSSHVPSGSVDTHRYLALSFHYTLSIPQERLKQASPPPYTRYWPGLDPGGLHNYTNIMVSIARLHFMLLVGRNLSRGFFNLMSNYHRASVPIGTAWMRRMILLLNSSSCINSSTATIEACRAARLAIALLFA